MTENLAPFGIVRHRPGAGQVVRSDTIDRYWRSRKDGSNVMVVKFLNVANEGKKRIVFVGELAPTREVSCDYADFMRDFETRGNVSSKF